MVMIEKMKFLSITGPKADIDRMTETYLSKYEIHLENALDGVLWKSWLEQTTVTPALCACPMRAGSPSRFGKNSMSSRSAQPLTQTVPQKSAYCCRVREE